MKALNFVKSLSNSLVRGCTKQTPRGVTLFTPDGIASYDALWLRDFSYMVEYDGDSISTEELEGCIRFAMSGKREDGWFPDRIYADGLAVYAAGEVGKPVGEANLDNTPFLVYMISDLMKRLPDDEASALFTEWYPDVMKGLFAIPTAPSGLVWSDPAKPHSPYGFTDTVAKTGELMMESLLLWRAYKKMDELCKRYGVTSSDVWAIRADIIERSIFSLYDPETGMFFAASGDCHQIDIWGAMYMLYIGFPAGAAEQSILKYLTDHREEYLFHGQVRHLPRGEYWDRLLIEVEHETYQNGAYWATASGWAAWCLFRANPQNGIAVMADVIRYLHDRGSFECVNQDYEKLGSFVVSATNVLGGMKRMISEDPTAEEQLDELLSLED